MGEKAKGKVVARLITMCVGGVPASCPSAADVTSDVAPPWRWLQVPVPAVVGSFCIDAFLLGVLCGGEKVMASARAHKRGMARGEEEEREEEGDGEGVTSQVGGEIMRRGPRGGKTKRIKG